MFDSLGRCCIFVPLRLGIWLLGLWTALCGILCLIGLFIDDVRLMNGGYDPSAFIVSGTIGSLGIVFGFFGCLGAHDNSANYTLSFMAYYIVSLLVHVATFALDLNTLSTCETWLRSIDAQSSWNPTMEAISRQGLCTWTRVSYATGFALDMLFGCYFASVLHRYWRMLENAPTFLISFPGAGAMGGDAFIPGSGFKVDYANPPSAQPFFEAAPLLRSAAAAAAINGRDGGRDQV